MTKAETRAGLDPERLADLRRGPLNATVKGVPLGVSTTLEEIAAQGWNVARGDLALPVTTLDAAALQSNVETMADYCRRHGVLLAPHGKTTMAPQIFERQLAAGAWGLTCATPSQAAVMRSFGVRKIIMANPVTEPAAWRWILSELAADPGFEFYSLVDGREVVALIASMVDENPPARPVDLLLEVGVRGGRSGVRTLDEAAAVADAVAASPFLRLAGVETYEGLAAGGDSPEDLEAVDDLFALVRRVVTRLADEGSLGVDGRILVTAGGSSYFDRVVADLTDWSDLAGRVDVILRSGCYVSHDAGKYERLSPLAGRINETEPTRLINALTSWAAVLSNPEPGLAILGAGKRDVAHDLSLPLPRSLHRRDGSVVDLRLRSELVKLMDQHAFMRFDVGIELAPGDIVALDVSHPCTAFDKAPFIPIIDGDNTVVDAVLTFF